MAITEQLGGRRARTAGVRPDSPFVHVDWVIVATLAFLAGIGLVMIRSVGKSGPFVQKQGFFIVLGIGVMLAIMSIDYRAFVDNAVLVYLATVVMLVAVISPLGTVHKGAQGWFDIGSFQLQPAEFAKVSIIIALAGYGAAQRNQLDLRRFVVVLVLTAIPTALIFIQPDLGSALVFLAIVLAMLWLGGARASHVAILIVLGAVSVFVAVRVFHVLADYQTNRLLAFINPDANTGGSAFNLHQSKIAIGSGGLFGKGLDAGTQTRFGFVPEQHSDFIFTALCEQLGFLGGGAVLLAFGVLCARIWRAAASARDTAGTLICVGVLAMFLFHIFQNVGMTLGMMPITGIPLPFLSYGGSAILVSFAAIGLVLNVEMHRFR
jgi:rod shape determining protein RodA